MSRSGPGGQAGAPASVRLGEILLERGFVTPNQLQQALDEQARTGRRLGETLLQMGVVTDEQLNWVLSERLRVPYVELDDEVVDFDLVRSMPESLLRSLEAVPVLRVGDELTVVVADPTNQEAAAELHALTGARVSTAMAARERVRHLLDKAFPPAPLARGRPSAPPLSTPGAAEALDLGPAYSLLLDALHSGATDLVVEPGAREAVVRTRMGGALVEVLRVPMERLQPLVARFRALAGVHGDGAPREAQVQTRLGGQDVELEMLFYRTLHGEAITVRLHAASPGAPTLDDLDLPAGTRATLAGLVASHDGLVLVTGWDARARAALLYALARAASRPGRRTLTVERAVSHVVPDFLQVEAPDDFAASAALLLRQAADVFLVEDLSAQPVCAEAFGSAEQGALVLGGLGFATTPRAVGHLLGLDLPRAAFLALLRGVVQVRGRGGRYHVEAQAVSEAFRSTLLAGKDPWTSPSS